MNKKLFDISDDFMNNLNKRFINGIGTNPCIEIPINSEECKSENELFREDEYDTDTDKPSEDTLIKYRPSIVIIDYVKLIRKYKNNKIK